jgi:NTP pyrophosphatase (non-canonical NTP hydrolase)
MSFSKREQHIATASREKWGIISQMLIAIEEMAELTYALTKVVNNRNPNYKNVAEELADVGIIVEHLTNELNLTTLVKKYRKQKFDRLEARVQGDKLPKNENDH